MGNRKIQTRSTKCQNRPEFSTRLVNCSGPSSRASRRAPEIRVDRHPADHVQPVQAGEREVDREEGVGGRIETMVELGRVLEVLDDQEDEAGQDRRPHVQPELPKSLRTSDAQAITIVTRDVIRITVLSVASGMLRFVSPRGQSRRRPRHDIAREQGAEQHHLGGQEQPDADLAVVEPGVGPHRTV